MHLVLDNKGGVTTVVHANVQPPRVTNYSARAKYVIVTLELPDDVLDPPEVLVDLTDADLSEKITQAVSSLTQLNKENKND